MFTNVMLLSWHKSIKLLLYVLSMVCVGVYAQAPLTNTQPSNKENQANDTGVLSNQYTAATQQLIALLTNYQSMQTNFEQAVYDGDSALLQQTLGTLILKKPNRMVWQSQPPYAQTIVSNGDTLWVYDPDLEQVTIRTLDEQYNNSPAMLFSGDLSKLAERFLVINNPAKPNNAVFTLYNQDVNSLYQSIELAFENDLITKMQISDTLGQKTNIVFSNQKLNPVFSDDYFHFIPPANTDIIRQ